MSSPLDQIELTLDQKGAALALHLEKAIPLDDAIHEVVKESLKKDKKN
jgi:hypothetical protein